MIPNWETVQLHVTELRESSAAQRQARALRVRRPRVGWVRRSGAAPARQAITPALEGCR